MGKIVMIAALTAVLVRVTDNYFYYGRYTDAVMSMAHDVLRSLGI